MPKKATFALDIAAAVLATVAVLPQITGIAAHEWLGLVALAAFLLHLAASLNALSSLLKAARFGSALAMARIVLDAALFIAIAVCVVSGVLISATVLPMFGLFAPGYFIWNPLHAASAKVLLALVLVHVAMPRWQARCPGEEIVCDESQAGPLRQRRARAFQNLAEYERRGSYEF